MGDVDKELAVIQSEIKQRCTLSESQCPEEQTDAV